MSPFSYACRVLPSLRYALIEGPLSSQGSFVRAGRAWPGFDVRVDVDGSKPVLLAGMSTSIRGDALTLIHEDDWALPIKEPYLATSMGSRATERSPTARGSSTA